MFTDAFTAMFDSSELDALSKCNQFGRFPILPLSTTLEPAIVDGNLSDDSASPTTPLDAYNLNLHTLAFEKVDPFASSYEQCLPLSALYISPPQLHSDVESSSSTDPSSPDSEHAVLPTPIVPSQAPSASKKRSSSSEDFTSDVPTPSAAKKPRVSTSRIRAKDFVPPDVSGLSKREARLVKNRAAAFLSRQRKREEFEAMEIRLAELERENQELRRASSEASSSASSCGDATDPMKLQLSSMRQLLQDAEEREGILRNELEQQRLEPATAPSPSANTTAADHRASLGVMAVLSLSSVLKNQDVSWAKEFARSDKIAFCDSTSGQSEIEVSCVPCADGKLRVRLHQPSEESRQDGFPWSFDTPSLPLTGDMEDLSEPKRMRVVLSSAKMHADGAELEVVIR